MPYLSVIIPVYNEVKTINELIERVNAVPVDKEIIVVDDGSTDGTGKALRGMKLHNLIVIHHIRNKGKGAAFRTGLLNSTGEYVIVQDADLEYDPQDYLALLDHASKNNLAVVYGSRFLRTRRVTSLLHYIVNRFLTILTNILFKSSLTDMETCYKLVKLDLMRSLNIQSDGFELEPEITAKIIKNGYKISEVPVSYRPRSYRHGKKIKWNDGLTAVFCLLKLRFTRD